MPCRWPRQTEVVEIPGQIRVVVSIYPEAAVPALVHIVPFLLESGALFIRDVVTT